MGMIDRAMYGDISLVADSVLGPCTGQAPLTGVERGGYKKLYGSRGKLSTWYTLSVITVVALVWTVRHRNGRWVSLS